MTQAGMEHWIADEDVLECTSCSDTFTILNRRHHCRACGRIFCGKCTAKRIEVPNQGANPVRVCANCFDYVHKRRSYEKAAEFLQRGESFLKHGRNGDPHNRFVRLTEDRTMIVWKEEKSAAPKTKTATLKRLATDAGISVSGVDEGIPLSEIRSVCEGKNTVVFQRSGHKATGFCFSILARDRTLDLESDTIGKRDKWVSALRKVLAFLRADAPTVLAKRKDEEIKAKKELETHRSILAETNARRSERKAAAAALREQYESGNF